MLGGASYTESVQASVGPRLLSFIALLKINLGLDL